MMKHASPTCVVALSVALVASITGCSDGPAPRPPAAPSAAAPSPTPPSPAAGPTAPPDAAPPRADNAPPRDDTVAEFDGLRGPKPARWLWQPPQNAMRVANWTIPGTPPDDQAELIITSLAGDGGGVQANLQRWTMQWRGPDGQPVEPDVWQADNEHLTILIAEFQGDWQPTMRTSGFIPDQAGLYAIIERPDHTLFLTFGGDAETVAANRDAFVTLVEELRPVDAAGGPQEPVVPMTPDRGT